MESGERKQSDGIGCVLLIAAIALGIWSLFDEKAWYYVRYALPEGIPHANIIVGKQPNDCDFVTAPLGAKGCHYEKQVTVSKVVTGIRQTDNHPMLSYDNGASWQECSEEEAQKARGYIFVAWNKVQE